MGTWFEHVLEYSKHPREDNFLFLKYEDLHKVLQQLSWVQVLFYRMYFVQKHFPQ